VTETASMVSALSSPANCLSWGIEKPRMSAGLATVSSNGVGMLGELMGLPATAQHVMRRLVQGSGRFAEDLKLCRRILHQFLIAPAGFDRTQADNVVGLASRRVLAGGLADLAGFALGVEQIIGDLERLADVVGIAEQPGAGLRLGPRHDQRHFHRRR